MSLKAQNKLMAVPSRDLYLILGRSSDIIKYISQPNSQAQSRNKYQGNVQRFYPSSLYLTLLGIRWDLNLAFHTLVCEKRNDSVMKINR